ncbi:hypothetical protein [Flavobacterium sp.]|uniref:hypothetical protein n=1 Tax=Flavobacterium sp. TaxID=239 RepID=UPI00374C8C9B
MTFEQALIAKEVIGKTITINSREHNVYIGPYDQDDLVLWKYAYSTNISSFNQTSMHDDLAKEYSKNSQFKVYGIFQNSVLQLYKLNNELFTKNTINIKAEKENEQ